MKSFALLFLASLASAALAAEPAALKLTQTIPLPGVKGRFDHFAIDPAGKRLFVAALGNNTLEVVDLAAGMRFLVKFCGVASLRGVDATTKVVERGIQRCQALGLGEQISFTVADVCATGLPSGSADFVWGEDAWCYVVDKAKLIAEAARLVKPGGLIAFTDWIERPAGLSQQEADRFLSFMKFPNIQDLKGYQDLLVANDCRVQLAEDTGRFPPYVNLYLDMLNKQLTYDALRIIGFHLTLMQAMGGEMVFMQQLAHAGQLLQAVFVARKKQ